MLLNVRIEAGIYEISAVFEHVLRGIIAQRILLHEVADDIIDDNLFIVAVYLLDARVWAAHRILHLVQTVQYTNEAAR